MRNKESDRRTPSHDDAFSAETVVQAVPPEVMKAVVGERRLRATSAETDSLETPSTPSP